MSTLRESFGLIAAMGSSSATSTQIILSASLDAQTTAEVVRRSSSSNGASVQHAWQAGVVASELARNAVVHGEGGTLRFEICSSTAQFWVTNNKVGGVAELEQHITRPRPAHGLDALTRFARHVSVSANSEGQAVVHAIVDFRSAP